MSSALILLALRVKAEGSHQSFSGDPEVPKPHVGDGFPSIGIQYGPWAFLQSLL
jgi:hypothetical protein